MTVYIGKSRITVEDVVSVARRNEKIEFTRDAINKIKKCRKMLEKKIREKEIMYGVNTGIGELADVILTSKQVEQFQRYLIYSHAAGYGEPMPEEIVRAALFSRLCCHSKGHSGLRFKVVDTVKEMLNRGVTPVMCKKGSVGASGDLSPMAQAALVPMGEGKAFYKGKILNGKTAMDKAGIPTIVYKARDGLALINGSNVITGMGALELYDAIQLVKISEISAAMTLEVLNANMKAYDKRLHRVRGYKGTVECVDNILRIVRGSELLAQNGKKVQDAYTLRSTPQIVGAVKDAFRWIRQMIETELNGAADNPTFFPDENIVITGANFQGTPIAFALELLGISITTLSVLVERRINRLMNPALNRGLPAFLTEGAGMYSGLMLTQYTADSLVCENRILSHPACTGSIPAAADQEDFVSMGMTTAHKTRDIIDNTCAVIAIELIACAQALDFRRPLSAGYGTEEAYRVVRKYIPYLKEDRPLYEDINKLTSVVKSGEILEKVERKIGKLK